MSKKKTNLPKWCAGIWCPGYGFDSEGEEFCDKEYAGGCHGRKLLKEQDIDWRTGEKFTT